LTDFARTLADASFPATASVTDFGGAEKLISCYKLSTSSGAGAVVIDLASPRSSRFARSDVAEHLRRFFNYKKRVLRFKDNQTALG
jgi:hypothetical protein